MEGVASAHMESNKYSHPPAPLHSLARCSLVHGSHPCRCRAQPKGHGETGMTLEGTQSLTRSANPFEIGTNGGREAWVGRNSGERTPIPRRSGGEVLICRLHIFPYIVREAVAAVLAAAATGWHAG